MNVETRKSGDDSDVYVVSVSGDIDLSCSSSLRGALIDVVGKSAMTVVDMSGVDSIDSSGIASLVEGHQQAKKRGGRLVLAACGGNVLKVLGLAKLDDVFNMTDTVDDALGDLS